ncbi:MAG TPA: hypothetical protein VE442_26805 [Jatrophihabitans sp.]|nr:hypothetical protein [Jatrophihabitans sp.]
MPGRKMARHEVDVLDHRQAEHRRYRRQPWSQVLVSDDRDQAVGRLLAHNESAVRADDCDDPVNRDVQPGCCTEQAGCAARLVAAVPDVRLIEAIHLDRVAACPNRCLRVVLHVDREHAAGTDHHMVDVAVPLADRHRVQHAPLRPETVEPTPDLFFTLRADVPVPLLGLEADGPGEPEAHGRLRSQLTRLLPGGLAGSVQRQVAIREQRTAGRRAGSDSSRRRVASILGPAVPRPVLDRRPLLARLGEHDGGGLRDNLAALGTRAVNVAGLEIAITQIRTAGLDVRAIVPVAPPPPYLGR